VNQWLLTYEGADPGTEGLREALTTLGNGYMATRGALPETSADETHYPGTYVAGIYNRLSSEIAGRVVENESLVNVPNWLWLRFRIDDGPWLHPSDGLSDHRIELDLHRGVLSRHSCYTDPQGRALRLTQRRIVSMADPHVAALETTLVPVGWSGTITVESALDGTVENTGVARYRQLPTEHLEPVSSHVESDGSTCLVVSTNQSRIRIAQAARLRFRRNGAPLSVQPDTTERSGWVGTTTDIEVSDGDELIVEKVVALFTCRDAAISEPGLEACDRVLNVAAGFDDLLARHVVAWRHLWQRTDIHMGANHDTAMLLHLHMFHTMATVSPHSALLDVGVPARGLHGEAYRGHIFWDELFIFPFFSLRLPELTRSLLLYRFRRLGQARRAARELGHRGAMYPWQSASNGREETQTMHLNPESGHWLPDASHLQRHVNAAIAYNVWGYYQATGDEEFLRFYGAEMLLEIARFWASVATYDHSSDRYHITGVMGPDEYHEGYPDRDQPGLDNNAYTNVMAAWCLCRALDVLETLSPTSVAELRERLVITPEELDRWDEVSRKLRICFHDGGGAGGFDGPVISQFQGYEALEDFDWEGYRARYGDISRLDRILEAEGDSTNRYKLSKQADVLMLFYLFSADELSELFERLAYDWDHDLIPRNIAYYEPRTSNGSTLSRVVHSWIHARSDRERSWSEFLDALHSDINDIQGGTTPEGVHLGAMAGTIDLIQRCYTGIELRGDALQLDPVIPADLEHLELSLRYRDQNVHLSISEDAVTVRVGRGPTGRINVAVRGELRHVHPGETVEIPLSSRSDGHTA
jgi:alpha,alpha-trehalase